MPNMPSYDIVDMLVADGIVAKADTAFINKEPSAQALKVPDAFVVIYDSGGFDPEAAGKNFDKPTVNVRVKGRPGDFAGAQALIQSVKASLHQRTPETKNSTRYLGIWQMGEIAFVEYDDENRPVFSANFRVHRTYA